MPLTHDQLITAVTFMKLEVPEAEPGARHLSALPLFHVAGLANLAYVLFTGGHLHVLGGFHPAGFVDELAGRRIQLTQLVPTLIQAVTQEVSSREQRPDLSHLIEIVYGASPIRPDVLERAVTVLGCRFRQNYASSETGPLPVSSLSPGDHDPARGRLATAGRPSLGWEVRLGELGEIQVRGAAPLPGYWNDPEATAATLTPDGFYRMGDVGTIDADGFITIVERLKDMVITGGENVYPAEVEAVLAGHPAVADIAVIGIPDDRWGETVHAMVVAGPGLRESHRRAAELRPRTACRVQVPRPASRWYLNCRATRPGSCCVRRCASHSGPGATGASHDGLMTGAATPKGRATDEAFREAARVVFARDGYLNAKIGDIAAEAGGPPRPSTTTTTPRRTCSSRSPRSSTKRRRHWRCCRSVRAWQARTRFARPSPGSGVPTPSGAAS